MVYLLIIVLCIAAAVWIYKGSSGYDIVEYNITTGKDIPHPVRFVMLSDLHDTDVTHDNNERLLSSIDGLNPDFVILAGDMITSYMQPVYNSDKTFAFLKSLSSKHKVYYGLGNHEQRYKAEPGRFPGKYEELVQYVNDLGIELLSDRYIDIDDKNIRIYGFDIPIEKYKRGVKSHLPEGILGSLFGEVDRNKYDILIAHTPDHFDDYVSFGPDMVLSGHLHGGIIGIPGVGGLISPQLKLFPKYDHGMYDRDGVKMIVSRGIGWHSIPIRMFNRAEMVVVNIESDKKGNQNGDQR